MLIIYILTHGSIQYGLSRSRRACSGYSRNDEEFRYTVAGLIGLEDIRASVSRLQDAVAKLEDSIARLTDAQARTELALASLRREVGRLSDNLFTLRRLL